MTNYVRNILKTYRIATVSDVSDGVEWYDRAKRMAAWIAKETNIPEMSVNGISFEFSVGGDEKLNSYSWILKDFQFDFEKRIWGKFFNLYII